MLAWQFKLVNLPQEAIPVVIPFSNWQYSANYEVFTNQPRKI